RNMLRPFLPDRCGFEIALALQRRLAQELLRPVAQRSAEPRVNGNAEAHLRSFDEFPGHVTIEDLSQQPFPFSVPDLHAQGEPPREFGHPMIEKWRARFEADA